MVTHRVLSAPQRVQKPLALWQNVNAVCAYMWCHHMSGKEIGIFLLFASFGLKILLQLNIKAVHNLKTKSLGIILTPWAMFVPISTFLLFLVSEVT